MDRSIHDFRSRLADRSLGDMPNADVGVYAAEYIARNVQWSRMAELAHEARKHLPQVEAEISSLKVALESNRERMRRRAFLFGIATPNRDEMCSIGWALWVEPLYGTVPYAELARTKYRSLFHGGMVSVGLYSMIESALSGADVDDVDDVAKLSAVKGIGPKVARMIHAVSHPEARVWTVDIWHIRHLLWAADIDWRVRSNAAGKAYDILEAIWLEYCDRYFPGVDVWAVQWSTWCASGGEFLSHSALWADLEVVA